MTRTATSLCPLLLLLILSSAFLSCSRTRRPEDLWYSAMEPPRSAYPLAPLDDHRQAPEGSGLTSRAATAAEEQILASLPPKSRKPAPTLILIASSEAVTAPVVLGNDGIYYIAETRGDEADPEALHQAVFPDGPTPSPTGEGEGRGGQSNGPGDAGEDSNMSGGLGTFEYHLKNARRFESIKELDGAVREYEKALEIAPEHLAARLDYGACLEKQGRHEEALEQYARAAAKHPEEPRPWLKTGNVYLRKGTVDTRAKAQEAYLKALDIDPTYKYALYNMGLLARSAQDWEKALQWFNLALKQDAQFDLAHLNVARIYEQQLGDIASAIPHYLQYLELGGRQATEVRKALERFADMGDYTDLLSAQEKP